MDAQDRPEMEARLTEKMRDMQTELLQDFESILNRADNTFTQIGGSSSVESRTLSLLKGERTVGSNPRLLQIELSLGINLSYI